MKEKIFYVKSRMVGILTENCDFIKTVRASKHYMRNADGYGISYNEVVLPLLDAKCKKIIIYEEDNSEKWVVEFRTFVAKGWNKAYPPHEEQRFLHRQWWTIIDIKNPLGALKQMGRIYIPEEADKRQPTLFNYEKC